MSHRMSHTHLFIGYCIRFFLPLALECHYSLRAKKDFVIKVHLQGFTNEPMISYVDIQ